MHAKHDLHGYHRSPDFVRPDGVGGVVDLGKHTIRFLSKQQHTTLILLEAPELLDEVSPDFRTDPNAELRSDVVLRVGATMLF